MHWLQKEIILPSYERGFHVITSHIQNELKNELSKISIGIAYIFIKHTSASITINENMDPSVRKDFESHMNVIVPENASYYKHTMEGVDDMPAHLKSSILGSSLTIPLTNGVFNLGTWQGIYLCEHRNNASSRKLIITINGS
tara:strand:- start:136 stop:561 length:426 start_codon:yes stop_codon:yes gene_type:complete